VVKCLFDALRLLIEAILSRERIVYILSLHGLTQGPGSKGIRRLTFGFTKSKIKTVNKICRSASCFHLSLQNKFTQRAQNTLGFHRIDVSTVLARSQP